MKKINDEMQYKDVFDTINDNFDEANPDLINFVDAWKMEDGRFSNFYPEKNVVNNFGDSRGLPYTLYDGVGDPDYTAATLSAEKTNDGIKFTKTASGNAYVLTSKTSTTRYLGATDLSKSAFKDFKVGDKIVFSYDVKSTKIERYQSTIWIFKNNNGTVTRVSAFYGSFKYKTLDDGYTRIWQQIAIEENAVDYQLEIPAFIFGGTSDNSIGTVVELKNVYIGKWPVGKNENDVPFFVSSESDNPLNAYPMYKGQRLADSDNPDDYDWSYSEEYVDYIREKEVTGHVTDLGNPHEVTAGQVGAYTKAESSANVVYQIIGKEKVQMTLTLDYKDKISGSVVENPNKSAIMFRPALLKPNEFVGEISTNGYTQYSKLDNVIGSPQSKNNGDITQVLFRWNVLEALKRQLGEEFFVSQGANDLASQILIVKSIVKQTVNDVFGFGNGPNGNKISIKRYTGTQWESGTKESTNGAVTKLTQTMTGIPWITADGWLYVIAYADASDGATASSLSIDYANLTFTIELSMNQFIKSTTDYQIDDRNFVDAWKMGDGTFTNVYPQENLLDTSLSLNNSSTTVFEGWVNGTSTLEKANGIMHVIVATTVTQAGYAVHYKGSRLLKNTKYFFSIDAKGNGRMSMTYRIQNTAGAWQQSWLSMLSRVTLTADYSRYIGSFTTPNWDMGDIQIAFYPQDGGTEVWQTKPKLEISNANTIYTPAPSEDLLNAYPKYKGKRLADSDNPDDYDWSYSDEYVDYAIAKIDSRNFVDAWKMPDGTFTNIYPNENLIPEAIGTLPIWTEAVTEIVPDEMYKGQPVVQATSSGVDWQAVRGPSREGRVKFDGKKGDKVSFSIALKGIAADTSGGTAIAQVLVEEYETDTSNRYQWGGDVYPTLALNEWREYSNTYTIKGETTKFISVIILFRIRNIANTTAFRVAIPKLEWGDESTPYVIPPTVDLENSFPHYKGQRLTDSDNPDDYDWSYSDEYVDYAIAKWTTNKFVSLAGNETILGTKNFQDGIQIDGSQVGLVNDACWCEDFAVNNLAAGKVNPDIQRFSTSNAEAFSASGKVITIKKSGVYMMTLGVNYTGLTNWLSFGISRLDGTSLVNRNLLGSSTSGSNSLTYVRSFEGNDELRIEFNSGAAGTTMGKINLAIVKLA